MRQDWFGSKTEDSRQFECAWEGLFRDSHSNRECSPKEYREEGSLEYYQSNDVVWRYFVRFGSNSVLPLSCGESYESWFWTNFKSKVIEWGLEGVIIIRSIVDDKELCFFVSPFFLCSSLYPYCRYLHGNQCGFLLAIAICQVLLYSDVQRWFGQSPVGMCSWSWILDPIVRAWRACWHIVKSCIISTFAFMVFLQTYVKGLSIQQRKAFRNGFEFLLIHEPLAWCSWPD